MLNSQRQERFTEVNSPSKTPPLIEYERAQQEDLKLVRVKYLTRDGLDAVRGFYRGVFRAEGWKVANVESAGRGRSLAASSLSPR